MTSSSLRAVLFDLDGTLLDSAPDFIATVHQLADEQQLPRLPAERIRQTVSEGARALTQLLFELHQDNPVLEQRRQRLLSIYGEHLGRHSTLFAGMTQLLQQLQQCQLAWGIVTNKPMAFTERILAQLELPSPPAVVICPDHVSSPKPSPEPLLLACEQLHCRPDQVVYLGDHRRDVESGNRAGCETIAVEFGYHRADDEPSQWGATYTVGQTEAIWPIIKTRLEA